jgi:hypothetical protein
MVALFATCGRRLRAVSLLRPRHELLPKAGDYRIELTAEQNKTPKPDCFDLPDFLTPYFRHYLMVVRAALQIRGPRDALWMNEKGEPWTDRGIQHRFAKRMKERFGEAFGPHRCPSPSLPLLGLDSFAGAWAATGYRSELGVSGRLARSPTAGHLSKAWWPYRHRPVGSVRQNSSTLSMA